MSVKTESQVADALREVLVSPNVGDSNGEPANLVDVLDEISRGLWHGLSWRTDPATKPNAIEGHGEAIKEAAGMIACAISDLAQAIRDKDRETDALSTSKKI